MASKYTYGELAATLTALGFLETTGTTDLGASFRAFDNSEYDAWIMLPNKTDTELLDQAHLRAAERMIEGRGVADSDTFFKLLSNASHEEARAA